MTTSDLAEELELCLHQSETIPGWTRGEEARELLRISHSLAAGAIIVEIGSFFGAGTILLAGPRRIRGSGLVHCVDPFDGTGDSFSVHITNAFWKRSAVVRYVTISKRTSTTLVLAPGFGFIKDAPVRWHVAGSRPSICFISEAGELLRISHSLAAGAIIVEIGSFFGAGTVGPKKNRRCHQRGR